MAQLAEFAFRCEILKSSMMLVFRCSLASDNGFWRETRCMDAYLNRLMFMTRVFSFLFRCLCKDMQRRNERSIRRLTNIILICYNLKAAFKGFFYALSENKCLKLDMPCSKKKQISAD